MSKKNREEIMLERLKRAGLEVPSDQFDARFRFVISPVVTPGISDVSALAIGYQDAVAELIRKLSLISPISGIVFFPRVMDPHTGQFPDLLSYKRKERAIFVGVNVQYATWMEISLNARIDLFAENLVESIHRISEKYLYREDKNNLLRAINDSRETVRAKLLH
jgi:hypothetical protein